MANRPEEIDVQVRVVRTTEVKPDRALDFMKLSREIAEYTREVTGVDSQTYWNRQRTGSNADFMTLADFDSLADYESKFLEGLLLDGKYLALAEKGVDLIKVEPRDELLVRLKPDDYFMNLKGEPKGCLPLPIVGKRGTVPDQRPAKIDRRRRYLRERTYTAGKGQLRSVMQHTFHFMDQLAEVAGIQPEFFCTRFTAGSIGGGKVYIEYDDCPMCDALFIRENWLYATELRELLLSEPIDSLYSRVSEELVRFELRR